MSNHLEHVVGTFEDQVAEYSGSKYAIAVDSAAMAVFLACRYLRVVEASVPKRISPEVACAIVHAGGALKFDDRRWRGAYSLDPYPIVDASCRFYRNMVNDFHVKDAFWCLSFEYHQHLPIGRGGMILTNDGAANHWFRLARYSGRAQASSLEDAPHMIGWDGPLDVERAARGCSLMQQILDKPSDLLLAYPDLAATGLYDQDHPGHPRHGQPRAVSLRMSVAKKATKPLTTAAVSDGAGTSAALAGPTAGQDMRFVIWTPPSMPQFGGVTVLHKLCHLLVKRGLDASVWINHGETGKPDDVFERYNTPIANGRVDLKGATVVYPEIVDGNPLEGRRVVRWYLNSPGVMGGNGVYDDNELNVYWAPRFAPDADSDPAQELCVIERWPEIFGDPGAGPRKGGCFVVRKGRTKSRVLETANLFEMPNVAPAECAEIFKSHEIFYSYDTATFLSLEAAMSGCLSVVIPDEGVCAGKWRRDYPTHRYGVAYGLDELDWARDTQSLVKGYLESIEEETERQLDALLSRVQALS